MLSCLEPERTLLNAGREHNQHSKDRSPTDIGNNLHPQDVAYYYGSEMHRRGHERSCHSKTRAQPAPKTQDDGFPPRGRSIQWAMIRPID